MTPAKFDENGKRVGELADTTPRRPTRWRRSDGRASLAFVQLVAGVLVLLLVFIVALLVMVLA